MLFNMYQILLSASLAYSLTKAGPLRHAPVRLLLVP